MPMWDKSSEPLALQYHVPTSRINPLKCTAEHLDARKDGGKNSGENIVAACHFCNSHRHKSKIAKEPERYKSKVQTRIRKKSWTTKLIPSYPWRRIEFGQKKDITSSDVASDWELLLEENLISHKPYTAFADSTDRLRDAKLMT